MRRWLGRAETGSLLHEDLSRDDAVIGSSDRGFGLTIAAFLGLIGIVRLALGHPHSGWWLGAAVLMLLVALMRPAVLAPLNRAWLRLGMLLYRITNPLVMGLIFYGTVVPTGLLMRALGKDPLLRRRDPQAASYWIARDPPGPAPDSMKHQF